MAAASQPSPPQLGNRIFYHNCMPINCYCVSFFILQHIGDLTRFGVTMQTILFFFAIVSFLHRFWRKWSRKCSGDCRRFSWSCAACTNLRLGCGVLLPSSKGDERTEREKMAKGQRAVDRAGQDDLRLQWKIQPTEFICRRTMMVLPSTTRKAIP